MNLVSIANYLQSKNVGTVAKTIYVNMLPIDVSLGILLRNDLNGVEIDYELRGYSKFRFQAIVRAPSYFQGENLMQKLSDALTLVNTQIDEYHFNYIRPRTEPVVFPLSEGNFLEFSIYLDASCYRTANG